MSNRIRKLALEDVRPGPGTKQSVGPGPGTR